MVIRYWIREFEDEYRIAELRNGQIKALLESQPLAKSVWDSPIPPSGCFASLQFGELDFVLVGDLTNEDLESYSREIGPDCRAVKVPSLLDPSLKALIAGANGPCRLVSPDEPAEAATDSQIGVLLGEFGESRGESGRFTLSLDGMGAVGRHFEKPVKQLGEALENFFGAWGCCRFEQRQKRRALSSTFEFEFDGHREVRETLSWETLSGLFLSGGLRDWSTWWATTCHILREYPGFVDLTWVGPGFIWQLSFDKRGEPIARFIETAGGAHLHVVSIKVRHRLFGSGDALELRHLFLKHEKLLCDLNGSPNRIAILRGKDDFSLRDSLRFDGEIDEPFSLAIMHSRRNFIEFELNRRPIRVHNPLPCCIYVFGSRLRSDLAKNIRVPEELVAGIYRICAPYVHEALSTFCLETATHGSLQEHFSIFLTGSEQNRPGSVHQSAGRWSMDRRSVDIIEQFALVECHGCEPMSVRAVRDFWKGRVLLASHSFGKVVPTYLRHLPWVDRSNPHTQAMLKFRFVDTFVFED